MSDAVAFNPETYSKAFVKVMADAMGGQASKPWTFGPIKVQDDASVGAYKGWNLIIPKELDPEEDHVVIREEPKQKRVDVRPKPRKVFLD